MNPKLKVNVGLRWETQLPPTGLNDRWSDFSPTTPNPAAGNRPGALIYAGSGPGRVGSRTLADSYFKAFGPHVGFAYTLSAKTVVRGSYARSFAAITTVTGSTHQHHAGLHAGPGLPGLSNTALHRPVFANKDTMPWFQGRDATRPPEFNLLGQRAGGRPLQPAA